MAREVVHVNKYCKICVDLTLRRTTMCSNELPLAKNNELLFLMSNSRISSIFEKKRHSLNGSIHLVLPKPGQLASSRNYTKKEIRELMEHTMFSANAHMSDKISVVSFSHSCSFALATGHIECIYSEYETKNVLCRKTEISYNAAKNTKYSINNARGSVQHRNTDLIRLLQIGKDGYNVLKTRQFSR
ncbi:hypothetical protein V1477_003405 [Vespula maculifrons]|uniref:Uncharacterized protein n=1 Tax=Vespula maculifrons TaxID=7453 RepID=A0ABD2CUK2_VESMC